MIQNFIKINGLNLSYIDYGGNGETILALHGHFGRARMFYNIAKELRQGWRVIALDQRGHGLSESDGDFSREAYINDLAEFISKLNLAPVIVLGHSLGGVNAYQLAAKYPELVKAIIVEDIGPVVTSDLSYIMQWPTKFESIRAINTFFESNGFDDNTYFLESLKEFHDGWGFLFNYSDIIKSQEYLRGDWWNDWLNSSCPALIIHGHKSFALDTPLAREMKRRPNTQLVEFPECGHTIHDENPTQFVLVVKNFLEELNRNLN